VEREIFDLTLGFTNLKTGDLLEFHKALKKSFPFVMIFYFFKKISIKPGPATSWMPISPFKNQLPFFFSPHPPPAKTKLWHEAINPTAPNQRRELARPPDPEPNCLHR
jgi:hypothetical protein